MLNAGETEGDKAAALKSLEAGAHLRSGPVEVTWGSLGGSEYPQSLALGCEVAQCIFTSVKSRRMHMKTLGHVLQASFIGKHELDMQRLHELGDINCNVA